MAVIINHRNAAHDPPNLEAPIDSVEGREAFADRVGLHFQLGRDGNRGSPVEDVVASWDRQVESPQVRAPTNGPIPAWRKSHGMASPPEPAISLMIITFGPKIASIGVVMSRPSRMVKKASKGRRR